MGQLVDFFGAGVAGESSSELSFVSIGNLEQFIRLGSSDGGVLLSFLNGFGSSFSFIDCFGDGCFPGRHLRFAWPDRILGLEACGAGEKEHQNTDDEKTLSSLHNLLFSRNPAGTQ